MCFLGFKLGRRVLGLIRTKGHTEMLIHQVSGTHWPKRAPLSDTILQSQNVHDMSMTIGKR